MNIHAFIAAAPVDALLVAHNSHNPNPARYIVENIDGEWCRAVIRSDGSGWRVYNATVKILDVNSDFTARIISEDEPLYEEVCIALAKEAMSHG